MRVLIVEDEQLAYEKLNGLLLRINPDVRVIGHAKSVKEALRLIPESGTIDLAFFDIQLEDGLSFSILEEIDIRFPVVFTTAYDQYAIRAFDHYSIGYLLKPIQKEAIQKALEKYNQIVPQEEYQHILMQAIQQARKKTYKDRFTVKIGDRIRLFELDDIPCFFSRSKGTYLCTEKGKHYVLDDPLERIEGMINPELYFRVNRKHIIRISSIESMVQYSNSRLKVELAIPFDEEIIVAREKVKAFKLWLEGNK